MFASGPVDSEVGEDGNEDCRFWTLCVVGWLGAGACFGCG